MPQKSVSEIVNDAMQQLTDCLANKDLDGIVALFHEDGIFFGSADGESAVGAADVRKFFSRLFERPQVFRWPNWEAPVTGASGSLVWFVARSSLNVRDNQGDERNHPYRLSGVLEQADDDRWVFQLFNGSGRVLPAGNAEPGGEHST